MNHKNFKAEILATVTAFLFVLTFALSTPVLSASAEYIDASAIAVTTGVDYVEGEAIVCIRTDKNNTLTQSESEDIAEDVEDDNIRIDDVSVLKDISGTVIDEDNDCLIMLVQSDDLTTAEIITQVNKRDDIIYAEPNAIGHTASLSDYPKTQLTASSLHSKELSDSLTSYYEDQTNQQYNSSMSEEYSLHVPDWNTYDASGNPSPVVDTSDIVVAVIDTGIDYKHDELKDSMWDEGENFPSLVAMGGGKYGINVVKYDMLGNKYDTTDPFDDYGHGTHCAGNIAAKWNNIGISGVTTDTRLMAVKILNDRGRSTIVSCIQGYEYIIAAKKAGVNVRVASNSWQTDVYGHTMDILVREAGEIGIVSSFAAGNDSSNLSSRQQLQSSFYNNPYAVIVGATNRKGEIADFSNYSKKMVDVFAPGVEIYSTMPRIQGEIPIDASVIEKGGIRYEADYTTLQTEVYDNHINSVIGLSGDIGDNQTDLSVENIEGVGQVIKATSNSDDGVYIKSDMLDGSIDAAGGFLELYIDHDASSVYTESYNPNVVEFGHTMYTEDVSTGTVKVPFMFPAWDDETQQYFKINIQVNSGDEYDIDNYVYIKGIYLTHDVVSYVNDSGTSMATPAVAGEMALLSAKYPNESADKIAARVTGSVRQYDNLRDFSISGGIADVSKALSNDTVPVINTCDYSSGQLTIEGFFFGDNVGNVTVDGVSAPITSWSDTLVTIALSEGISLGENIVEVTSSEGKSGYRYDRLGTPANLYNRLPLPGRSLSADGTYTVTSNAYDDTFYGVKMKSLTGLDGSLYAVVATRDNETAIYRYDIASQTWEMKYHGGHTADTGACTYDGKLMFFANEINDADAYIGVYDPESNDVSFYLYNSEYAETDKVMINNGTGIYVTGGTYSRPVPMEKGFSLPILRRLNPDTMTFDILNQQGEEPYSPTNNIGIAYNNNDIYVLYGDEKDILCKMTVEGDEFSLVNLNYENPAVDGAAPNQSSSIGMVSLKDGIMMTGPVVLSDEKVVSDTYTAGYGDTKFTSTGKLMSLSPVYNVVACAYRGKYYAISITNYEGGEHVFIEEDVNTKTQYGDKISENGGNSDGGGSASDDFGNSDAAAIDRGVKTTIKVKPPKTGYKI